MEQPPENLTNNIEDMLDTCVDGLCEVLTEDNRVLFVGRLEQYDPKQNEVWIDLRRGSEPPQGVIHNMPVKVQIHVKKQSGSLVMLYGNVSLCAATYWTIIVRNVVACAESRRAFRQKVGVEAQILWGPGLHFRAKCQVEDISLVGVAIHSPLKLEIGSRIVLSIPALIEDGPNYELPCSVVVRRNTAEAGLPPKWRYGCDFGGLEEQVEETLCKDLFTLQARTMNRG